MPPIDLHRDKNPSRDKSPSRANISTQRSARASGGYAFFTEHGLTASVHKPRPQKRRNVQRGTSPILTTATDEPSRSDDDRSDSSDTGAELDEGSDSGDSLFAGTKRKRETTRRKRRTKAEIVRDDIQGLIRPVTEFPPAPNFQNKNLLKEGVHGIAEQERDKTAWKTDVLVGVRGIEGLKAMPKVREKYEHKVNRTDSRIYKKEKQYIGIDDGEDAEYDEDPVLWAQRDESLKVPVNFEGNQRRANPVALGHATPYEYAESLASPSIALTPARSFRGGSVHGHAPSIISPGTATNHEFTRIEDDGDLDALFEDGDAAENAINPEDVFEADQQSRRGQSTVPSMQRAPDHPSHSIIGATNLPDFAARASNPDSASMPAPRTEASLSWNHAKTWAKVLRREHELDFFDRGGERVDVERVLATDELQTPPALKALDDEAEVKAEEDDLLFVALQEEEEARTRAKEDRARKREELLKKHERAKALFKDLKSCVIHLIAQGEQKRRLERERQSANIRPGSLSPELSDGQFIVRPLQIDPSARSSVAPPDGPMSSRFSQQQRERPERTRLLSSRVGYHRDRGNPCDLRVQTSFGPSASDWGGAMTHPGPLSDRPERSRDHAQPPYSASSAGRGRGSFSARGGNDHRQRGNSRGRSRSAWSPRSERSSQSRGSFQSQSRQSARRAGGLDWGAGSSSATNDKAEDSSFVGWNPNSDELDPIKMQFGKK